MHLNPSQKVFIAEVSIVQKAYNTSIKPRDWREV